MSVLVIKEEKTLVIQDVGVQGIQGNTGLKGDTGATGLTGDTGAAGTNGTNGTDGSDGADGQGVPIGGTVGQVLEKIDATDFNTQWATPSGGGGDDYTQILQLTWHNATVGAEEIWLPSADLGYQGTDPVDFGTVWPYSPKLISIIYGHQFPVLHKAYTEIQMVGTFRSDSATGNIRISLVQLTGGYAPDTANNPDITILATDTITNPISNVSYEVDITYVASLSRLDRIGIAIHNDVAIGSARTSLQLFGK